MELSPKAELENGCKKRLGDVVLGVLVYPSIHTGGALYSAAVILQHGSHRFRLPADGLDDCFIGEKPVIPHAPFPPFPLGAAAGLFGYDSPLCCGCARTVCQFRAVEYA